MGQPALVESFERKIAVSVNISSDENGKHIFIPQSQLEDVYPWLDIEDDTDEAVEVRDVIYGALCRALYAWAMENDYSAGLEYEPPGEIPYEYGSTSGVHVEPGYWCHEEFPILFRCRMLDRFSEQSEELAEDFAIFFQESFEDEHRIECSDEPETVFGKPECQVCLTVALKFDDGKAYMKLAWEQI